MSDADKGFEWCPIQPWCSELLTRIEEARSAGTNVVNLSYSHPRGYFPNQIVRRSAIKQLMEQARSAGWLFDLSRAAPAPSPNRFFLPTGWAATMLTDGSLTWCNLAPFIEEIERRKDEALLNGRVVDMTGFHERGEIPHEILERIAHRNDDRWKRKMREQIEKLRSEANQDDGRAKTAEQRAEGIATKPTEPGDPTPLLQSAAALRERAQQARNQALFLEHELGDQG